MAFKRSCVFVIAVMLVASGCGGGSAECSPNDSRCEGQTLLSCVPLGALFAWKPTQCPTTCAEISHDTGMCVDSPTPIAACKQDGPTCWDNRITSCQHGYPTQTSECESGSTCMVPSGCAAVCAVGPFVAACLNEPGVCMRGNIAQCACGIPTTPLSGCFGGTCTVDSEYIPHCTLSPTTDSRCGDPTLGSSGFCADGAAYTCLNGYITTLTPCVNGSQCIADSSQRTAACGV